MSGYVFKHAIRGPSKEVKALAVSVGSIRQKLYTVQAQITAPFRGVLPWLPCARNTMLHDGAYKSQAA